ncbi:long-chain fatty acid--CoA ligase [Amycolatopsis acidicola]|uniref:Long-chain fatty acid--CoA ligase n=1 Tax=Amycolatopsis acidicola TaxID=2596893 RepID=A0A5N0UYM1_9PSEU|nr:AMP-binding protein [Amycolatopsis acidicola]KAA9156737.1 long-chain fatty acid--CoA ligase [Amycolatopsis acidicola]
MTQQNLAGLVHYWAEYRPWHTALHFEGTDTTWRELDARSTALARGLRALGVEPGDGVGILMRNRPEFVETVIAIWKAGAFVVPLNIRWTAAELGFPLDNSGVRLVVTEPHFAGVLGEPAADRDITVVSTEAADGWRTLEAIREPGPRLPEPGRDDMAFLFYTSGTTGYPKGVRINHGNIIASALAVALGDGVTWRDRTLVAIPMAFTGGMNTYVRETLICGATLVLAPRFDPEYVMHLAAEQRATVWSSVPVIFEQVLHHKDFGSLDLSSLWLCRAAGATVSRGLLHGWQERGITLAQGYGLTECSGGYLATLNPADAERKLGYAGRPVLHTEMRIVDDQDEELPRGEAGQIIARGPSIMDSYWKLPEETAEALRGGWLHTGDVGVMDEEGYIRVVDRKKDMLISGGLNVYPAEIERVLATVLGLEECAVIGVEDERWGEVPALIVTDAAAVDVPALRSALVTELADYKRPRYLIDNTGPLPRTLSGKIQKTELRKQYPGAPAGSLDLKAGQPV